jgi:hypothetical protein
MCLRWVRCLQYMDGESVESLCRNWFHIIKLRLTNTNCIRIVSSGVTEN